MILKQKNVSSKYRAKSKNPQICLYRVNVYGTFTHFTELETTNKGWVYFFFKREDLRGGEVVITGCVFVVSFRFFDWLPGCRLVLLDFEVGGGVSINFPRVMLASGAGGLDSTFRLA